MNSDLSAKEQNMQSLTSAPAAPVASGAASQKRSVRRKVSVGQIVLRVSLTVGGLVMLIPLVWVALSSLKRPDEILRLPVAWLPDNILHLDNYAQLFGDHNFGRYMINSFIVTGIGIGSSLVIALLAAFAFAFYNFKFKEPIFLLVLALFMVPPEAMAIPLFLMVSSVDLTNTYLGLAFPDLFTVLGVYLLRQFMQGIPFSYVEAARMDGSGELRILARIIVPMVAPAIAVFVIIKFMFSWNTFLWPLLVAQEESMFTVTVGLVNFAGSEFNQWNLINAATMISLLPIIVLFVALQRYLVKGVAMSGMK